MSVPDYQSLMLPLLIVIGDGKEHHLRSATEEVAKSLNLSLEDIQELLPSGTQTKIGNRVAWAKWYMNKAGLLEITKRGYFQVTERGLQVLSSNPNRIDVSFLDRFPEFRNFRNQVGSSKERPVDEAASQSIDVTPDESLEIAHQRLMEELARDLIAQVRSCTPSFFEQLVIDLLLKMGYGGSRQDAGKAIGKTGDGGIDGIIKEDKLGLDVIYVQAKKWDDVVHRPDVQKFAGALQGHQARKGVFITTSAFSKGARAFVSVINTKIILIDGELLAQLMIEHNVGVTPTRIYELKNIDSDYFEAR